MTPEQLAAIKANINATPTLLALWQQGEMAAIAAHYNAVASPAFYVWRSTLPFGEVLRAFVAADWTALDNLTDGQDRIWRNLKDLGSLDLRSDAIRAALTECWKGTAAKVAVRDRIIAMGYRACNNIEKLLSSGAGTTGSPATAGYEGTIDWPVVAEAMGA